MTDSRPKQTSAHSESSSGGAEFTTPLRRDDELKKSIHALALPQSNLWFMSEMFRQHLKRDKEQKIFNERFIEGISDRMQNYKKEKNTRLRICWIAAFLALALLWQYQVPISLPYIKSTSSAGLLDISVIVMCYVLASVISYTIKEHMCATMLLVYCEERYGENGKEFMLFRWDMEALYINLGWNEYMGKELKKPWKIVHSIASIPVALGFLISLVIMTLIAVWGMCYVLLHPTFGIASILLTVMAFGTVPSRMVLSL